MKSPTKAERAARRIRQRQQRATGLIVLGVAILVAFGALLVRQFQPGPKAEIEVSGKPNLVVDQERIDLGDVRLGQTASATFRLTNTGDQPLQITKEPYVEVLEGC